MKLRPESTQTSFNSTKTKVSENLKSNKSDIQLMALDKLVPENQKHIYNAVPDIHYSNFGQMVDSTI